MALRTLLTRKTLANSPMGMLGLRGLQTFSLPDLSYDYGALEPAISGDIMQLHHQKHHQTYITNYNKALEQLDDAVAKCDPSAVVKLHSAIKFNGGDAFLEPLRVLRRDQSTVTAFSFPDFNFSFILPGQTMEALTTYKSSNVSRSMFMYHAPDVEIKYFEDQSLELLNKYTV